MCDHTPPTGPGKCWIGAPPPQFGGPPIGSSAATGHTTAAFDGDFCDLALRAATGQLGFNDPAQVAALADHPDLSDRDRTIVISAVRDAQAQLAGGSYSNDQMVAAVNDICDLHLTPVTMVP